MHMIYKRLPFIHIMKYRLTHEVCSFALHYTNSLPPHIDELHVFIDACGGQIVKFWYGYFWHL